MTEQNLWMLAATAGMVLFLSSITLFISKRHLLTGLFLLDFLATFILVADTNFFRYYYKAISMAVFYQFDVSMVGSVNSSIMSLFVPKYIIFLLDLPVVAIIFRAVAKKNRKTVTSSLRIKTAAFTALASLLLMTSFFVLRYDEVIMNSSNSFSSNGGVLLYHVSDIAGFTQEKLFNNENVTEEDKELLGSYLKGKQVQKESQYEGLAKGKNLIMIQMEAMQNFVIGLKINGWEVTPNLNKLIRESLYFNNIYYQVSGGNTSDAEFLANTSLYPAKEGSVYYRYPENEYITLPELLKAQGYSTSVLHAFTKTFWNRDIMYNAIGFDRFYSQDDFTLDDFAGWDGESALSDASFFRQGMEKLDMNNPFYSFFITLSSHHPFTYFKDSEFYTGNYEGTYMGNYLKAAGNQFHRQAVYAA